MKSVYAAFIRVQVVIKLPHAQYNTSQLFLHFDESRQVIGCQVVTTSSKITRQSGLGTRALKPIIFAI